MTVNIETRVVESPTACEIYISATPQQNGCPRELARELFCGIQRVLSSRNARILQERVFGTEEVMETLGQVRRQVYEAHGLEDGVAPSFLVGGEGLGGAIAGVQVYALGGEIETDIIEVDSNPRGRVVRAPNHTFVTLSGVSVPWLSRATEQARACLERAEWALRKVGADFLSVARTWVWLNDILSWYDEFNGVRNRFFAERGIIGRGGGQSPPASTGIGLGAADRSDCAMDLFAVIEPADSTRYLQAGGRQGSALEYGSAFSRASRTATPAGETVFVSGTAAIDTTGATMNVNDARGQINTTIENVRAVLRDAGVTDSEVVHAVAYCKTPEVERVFNAIKREYSWPWITTICDICRPDLLFEVEATAVTNCGPPN